MQNNYTYCLWYKPGVRVGVAHCVLCVFEAVRHPVDRPVFSGSVFASHITTHTKPWWWPSVRHREFDCQHNWTFDFQVKLQGVEIKTPGLDVSISPGGMHQWTNLLMGHCAIRINSAGSLQAKPISFRTSDLKNTTTRAPFNPDRECYWNLYSNLHSHTFERSLIQERGNRLHWRHSSVSCFPVCHVMHVHIVLAMPLTQMLYSFTLFPARGQ